MHLRLRRQISPRFTSTVPEFMSTRADRILEQVVDKVEPLTRFDRTSLTCRGQDERLVKGTATWEARFHLAQSSKSGKGPLPSHVRAVGKGTNLDHAITAEQNKAAAVIASQLKAWAHNKDASDRMPEVGDCFPGPIDLGAQFTCAPCSGQGSTQCRACHGRGETECHNCNGRGKLECNTCHGKRTEPCPNCRGSVSRYEQKSRSVWHGGSNQYITENYTELVYCEYCNRRGYIECRGCQGRGEIDCGVCVSGTMKCPNCQQGRIGCEHCAETGATHEIRHLTCSADQNFQVLLTDSDAEVTSRFQSLGLEDLHRLASTRQKLVNYGSTRLIRNYEWDSVITRLCIEADGRSIVLTGFGDSAHVFDFKNIVGLLLQSDVRALQAMLKDTSPHNAIRSAPLLEAIKQCIRSEANVTIASAKDPSQAFGATAIVAADYARVIRATVRSALHHIYFGAIFRGAAIAAVLPASLRAVIQWVGLAEKHPWPCVTIPLVAGGVVLGVSEYVARQKVKKRFGQEQARIADRLLVRQRVVWWWRIGASAIGIVLFVAVLLVLR